MAICSGSSRKAITNVEKIFRYQGQINVSTYGGLSLRSPISALSPENYSKLEFEHAEGALDIKQIEHKCNPADSISIKTLEQNNVSLLNGLVVASGRADAQNFRERSFGLILPLLLVGMVTLSGARKKKKDSK